MERAIREAAGILSAARELVVLTGAGISTESGIPDFRSPGGIWSRFDPAEFTYQNFVASRRHRERYWKMSLEIQPVLAAAAPNPAHEAVTAFEQQGRLRALVTQNIDGLHHDAGTSPGKIIEIHGTSRRVVCLSCGESSPREEVQARVVSGESDPACRSCGGILKPATVSFGQAMPEEETALAFQHAECCDAFLVIGSSLVVYPAAWLPVRAVEAGAPLVIVNLEETPCDGMARVAVHGKASDVMRAIVREIERS